MKSSSGLFKMLMIPFLLRVPYILACWCICLPGNISPYSVRPFGQLVTSRFTSFTCISAKMYSFQANWRNYRHTYLKYHSNHNKRMHDLMLWTGKNLKHEHRWYQQALSHRQGSKAFISTTPIPNWHLCMTLRRERAGWSTWKPVRDRGCGMCAEERWPKWLRLSQFYLCGPIPQSQNLPRGTLNHLWQRFFFFFLLSQLDIKRSQHGNRAFVATASANTNTSGHLQRIINHMVQVSGCHNNRIPCPSAAFLRLL